MSPTAISIVQIILAILLIAAILLQQRGSGLSGAFGGQGGVYYQRRGLEKILFWATMAIAVAWGGVALATLLIL